MNDTLTNNGEDIITSDKELLEDFLNSLELNNNELSEIESITPEMRLNRFLWVIKQKENELNKCQVIADESIKRTTQWLEMRSKRINDTIGFLTNQMINYLNVQNLKSLSLPNGIIGLRRQPDIINVSDEELFFKNAKSELLRHKPEAYEADLKAIKNYIKQNDAIPEGIEVIHQDSKFYYKFPEE